MTSHDIVTPIDFCLFFSYQEKIVDDASKAEVGACETHGHTIPHSSRSGFSVPADRVARVPEFQHLGIGQQ